MVSVGLEKYSLHTNNTRAAVLTVRLQYCYSRLIKIPYARLIKCGSKLKIGKSLYFLE